MHCNRILKFEKNKINKLSIFSDYFLFDIFILSHGAEQILNAFLGVSIELELCNNILYYYFKIPQV